MFGSLTQWLTQWLLDKFFGKYIDNLNLDSLTGSVISGYDISLNELDLKAEALAGLELPIEVKAGHIGSLRLTIPGVSRITSDPVILKIETLIVLASPTIDRDYDEKRDQALAHARKMETLKRLENMLHKQMTEQATPSQDVGFVETMKLTMLQNLIVEITNIHVRYEDDVTNKLFPFAAGITLDNLSLQPADIINSVTESIVKSLKVEDLAVYWNCNLDKKALVKDRLEDDFDWKESMVTCINEAVLLGVAHDYFIDPIMGNAEMTFNLQQRQSQPKVTLTGSFERINVSFTRSMYLNAIELKDSFDMMLIAEKYRKYRPINPISTHTAEWWRFAVTCIIEEKVKPKRDFFYNMFQYRKLFKDYIKAYTELLLTDKPSKELENSISKFEEKLNIESIVMARKQAEIQLPQHKNKLVLDKGSENNSGGILSYFTGFGPWWSGEKKTEKKITHIPHPSFRSGDWMHELSDKEKAELEKAFKFKRPESSAPTSVHRIQYKADINLTGIQLNLLIDSQTHGDSHAITLYLSNINGSISVRDFGWRADASLTDLEVYQHAQPTEPKMFIVETDTSRRGQLNKTHKKSKLLSLTLQLNPDNSDADFSIDITTIPLRFTYQHDVVTAVLAFFYIRSSRFNIKDHITEIQPEFSAAGLQYALNKQLRIKVTASLSAPYLILPDAGHYETCQKLLLFDLGHLDITTKLRPKSNEESVDIDEKFLYDRYNLSLTDMKLIFTDKSSWTRELAEQDSDHHIIPTISANTNLYISAEPKYTELPMIKMDVDLGKLEVKITENNLNSLVVIFARFPQPQIQSYLLSRGRLRTDQKNFIRPVLEPAGLDQMDRGANLLLRNEGTNPTVDELHMQELDQLEDRHIFVTQGDLYNLWMLLATDKKEKKTNGETNPVASNQVTKIPNKQNAPELRRYASIQSQASLDDEFSPSNDSVGLHLPGVDNFTTKTEDGQTTYYTMFYIQFNFKEFLLRVLTQSKESPSVPQDFLTLSLSGLNACLAKTSLNLSARLTVSQLTVLDHLHLTGPEHTPCKVISSSGDEDLIQLEVLLLDSNKKLLKFIKIHQQVRFTATQLDINIQDTSILLIRSLMLQLKKQYETALPHVITADPDADSIASYISSASHDGSRDPPEPEPRDVTIPSPVIPETVQPLTSAYALQRQNTVDSDIFYDARSDQDYNSITSNRSIMSFISARTAASKILRGRDNEDTKTSRRPNKELNIRAEMKRLSVNLIKDNDIIAQLHSLDMSAVASIIGDSLTVDAKLGNLCIKNPQCKIYSNVMVMEESSSEMMSLTYKSSPKQDQTQNHTEELKVTLRKMRFVYISSYINQLQSFLSKLVSSSAVDSVKINSASAITNTAKMMNTNTQLKLDIKASVPVIIVPESPTSDNGILISLGDLSIQNKFVNEPIPNEQHVQQTYNLIHIQLENMGAESYHKYNSSQGEAGIQYVDSKMYRSTRRQLLTPITTEISIKQAQNPVHKTSVDLQISANVRHFKVEISDLDMQLLGRVLYQNILHQDAEEKNLDYTDIGSTISSVLSSQPSTFSSTSSNLKVELDFGGFTVLLSRAELDENQSQPEMVCSHTNISKCCVGSARVVYNKAKKSDRAETKAELSNFTIEYFTEEGDQCETKQVVELCGGGNRILSISFIQEHNGDSNMDISVQQLKFNVNLPFIKSMNSFLQTSFSTWKSEEKPKPSFKKRKRQAVVRSRKQGVGILTRAERRISQKGTTITLPPRAARRLARATALSAPKTEGNNNTTMTIKLKLGRQSLWLITGDGSNKALVAELDCNGLYKAKSNGDQTAEFSLKYLCVFSTSINNQDLRHMIMQKCSLDFTWERLEPLESLVGRVPPKVNFTLKISPKVVVELSTNLIYHIFDAYELLMGGSGGESKEDDPQQAEIQIPEQIGQAANINKQDWLDKYESQREHEKVEVGLVGAAAESATINPFVLALRFSVAVGDEFTNILRSNISIGGIVSDWSTKIRCQADLSIQADFYNERLDVWEPLVEAIYQQIDGKWRPWNVLVRMARTTSHPISMHDADDILADSVQLDPSTHKPQTHSQPEPKPEPEETVVKHSPGLQSAGAQPSHTELGRAAHTQLDRAAYMDHQALSAIAEEEIHEDSMLDKRQVLLHSAGATTPAMFVTQPSVQGARTMSGSTSLTGADMDMCDSINSIDERDGLVEVGKKDEKVETLCTYLVIISQEQLNINVTPVSVNVLHTILNTFTSKPKDSIYFNAVHAEPLIINNHLGMNVDLVLHSSIKPNCVNLGKDVVRVDSLDLNKVSFPLNQEKTTLNTEEQLPDEVIDDDGDELIRLLASKTAKPFSDTSSSRNLDPNTNSKRQLRNHEFHLSIDGYYPISFVNYRKSQVRHFCLISKQTRNSNLCITVNTSTKHSRRKISIFAKLSLYNDLDCTIQLINQGLEGEDIRTTVWNVKPGEWFNVPANIALKKGLYMRPANQPINTSDSESVNGSEESNQRYKIYQESSTTLSWRNINQKDLTMNRKLNITRSSNKSVQIIDCNSAHDESCFSCRAVWMVNKCLAKNCSKKDCPAFNIIIKPASEIENFLPFEVELQITVETPVYYQTTYTVEPGKNVQLREAKNNLSKTVYIIARNYRSITWRGFIDLSEETSRNNTVSHIKLSEYDEEADETDSSNQFEICCNIMSEVDRMNAENSKFSLYAPYWLSNTTGKKLQFQAAGIGQPLFSTDSPEPFIFTPGMLKRKLYIRAPTEDINVYTYTDEAELNETQPLTEQGTPPGRLTHKDMTFGWSDGIDCDAAGTMTQICTSSRSKLRRYRFMVEVSLSSNKLTKIITVLPLFVILNNLTHTIQYREHITEKQMSKYHHKYHIKWRQLQPDQSSPFWPESTQQLLSMIIKAEGADNSQTRPFPIDKPSVTLLPLAQNYLTADVSGGVGSEYFITLRDYQLGDIPVKIDNLTDNKICLHQQNINKIQQDQEQQESEENMDHVIVPVCSSYYYIWSDPLKDRRLFWSIVGKMKNKTRNVKKSANYELMLGKDGCGETMVDGTLFYWESRLECLQRVISFTDDIQFKHIIRKKNEEEQTTIFFSLALESFSLSLLNDVCEIGLISAVSSHSKWHVELNDEWYYLGSELSDVLEMSYSAETPELKEISNDGHEVIKVDVKRMEFVAPFSGRIKRQSFPGIRFQYQQSDLSCVMKSVINHLQIDNLLMDAFYPVVLQPTPPSRFHLVSLTDVPSVSVFICRTFATYNSPNSYKNVAVRMKEHALRVDKGFILTLVDFVQECTKRESVDQAKLRVENHLADIEYCMRNLDKDTIEKTKAAAGEKIYVENLNIQPIKLRLSFSLNGVAHVSNSENTQSLFGGDVVDFLLSSIGIQFIEVTDVEFLLDRFNMICTMTSLNKLQTDTLSFYQGGAFKHLYVIVLGLDFIGNPLGLMRNVSRGAAILSQPSTSQTPREQLTRVSTGLTIISSSLSATMSKITESVGRGFALLTFDVRYRKKRNRRLRSEPSHLPATLLLSARNLVYSFYSAAYGVVKQPRQGIEESGARGFFLGSLKGLVGIFVKPFGGIFDSISLLFAGASRIAEYGDYQTVRVRQPRPFVVEEGYKTYQEYFSEGFKMLCDLNDYQYSANNVYWSHVKLVRGPAARQTCSGNKHQYVLIATTRNLYLLYYPWYSSTYKIHWRIEYSDIDLQHNKPKIRKNNTLTLYQLSTGETKELTSDDDLSLRWFMKTFRAALNFWRITQQDT